MTNKQKYEVHVAVESSAVITVEADSELDAELEAQHLLDTAQVGWDEYEVDLVAIKMKPGAYGLVPA